MDTRSVATVFGGSGFIGRYVVRRLAQRGFVVRVVGRDPASASFLRPMGQVGQIVPMFASLTEDATINRAVQGADVVVNLVGLLAERRAGDFQRIQADGAGRVAQAAARHGAKRLVQISAIGADATSPSQYARTKAAGEAAVHAAMPDAVVLRPSVVFGAEDKFFNLFGRYGAVAAVHAGDLRRHPVAAGVCRRCGRCGDGGGGAT